MILILKRDDLPQEHYYRAVKDLELDHSGLPPELIEKVEMVVFVEGTEVKFLKHFPDFQSKNSLDLLTPYMTSKGPTTIEDIAFNKKRIQCRKKD